MSDLRAHLREEMRRRHRRTQALPADMLSDAAWAMLCDLGLQSLDGRAVSITSACIASGAPPTTALRWIAWLIEAGLATRAPDEFDSRRSWLAITAEGIEALERSFGAIADTRVAA